MRCSDFLALHSHEPVPLSAENYNKIVGKSNWLALQATVMRVLQYLLSTFSSCLHGNIVYLDFASLSPHADILSRLKIQCLEQSRDEARRKFRTHRREYVVNCLGRPLEKLSVSPSPSPTPKLLPHSMCWSLLRRSLRVWKG